MTGKIRNNTQYIMIYAGVFAGVMIVLYLLVGRPIFNYVQRMRNEFAAKQKQLQDAEELVRGVPNPQQAIEEIQQKVAEFRKTGVSGKQLPRIMQVLGQSLQEFDIAVVSIRPREDIRSDQENLPAGVNKAHIEMIFVCSYRVLGAYMKKLAELPGSFVVESLALAGEEEKTLPEKAPAGQKAKPESPAPEQKIQVRMLVSTYMVWEL